MTNETSSMNPSEQSNNNDKNYYYLKIRFS